MMQKKIAVSVLAGAVLLGTATGAVAATLEDPSAEPRAAGSATAPEPTPEPTESASDPTPRETPDAEPQTVPLDELPILTGSVGSVEAGMSKQEALETGYFDADVDGGCESTVPLGWKDEYADALDVQTSGNGTILSIGIRGEGPTTRSGYGIGTTWGELKDAMDGEPKEAGYAQTGAFVYDSETAGWIGFLFDTPPEQLDDSDEVTFIEVTQGAEPGLVRDGC